MARRQGARARWRAGRVGAVPELTDMTRRRSEPQAPQVCGPLGGKSRRARLTVLVGVLGQEATERCFTPRWCAPGDWPGPPASIAGWSPVCE
jgi:hypothetical protein